MRSVSCRGLGSIWSCLLISLCLSACGAEPASPREAGDGADTGGDTTPAVTPGVAGGPCYPNNSCNDGLACSGGICADPGAAAGVVGGPCYPNDTCNAGLVCLGAVCAVASVDDTGVDTGVDTGSDTGGSGDTGPAPDTDTPPVEETIGPAGGVIEFGDIRLTVPGGALTADTAITISYAEDQAPAGYERYTAVYRFEPAGTTFAIPATVSARFTGDSGRATLFWTPEGATGFERRGGRVGGDGRLEEQITHFSEGFVGDGVRYTDSSDRSCVVTRLLEGRNATSAGINGGLALFFTVDDCEGRPVTGLTNSDFRLLEDGRPLSSEAQATVLPADGRGIFVSLVLDFSSSTEPVLPDLLDGAAAFLTALEEARLPAQVQIMAFGGDATAYVAQRYTLDVASARAALTGLSAWRPTDIGATNLHGAVAQALSASATAQSAFRARNLGGAFSSGYVVVFTDGGDTAERVTLEQVQSAVSGSPDEVFMVGLRGADYDEAALTAIAPARNVLAAPSATEIEREFAALANRIAGQASRTYLLGYCSPKRAGSHTVSVEVSGSDNLSAASFDFGADGFTGSCRASAFATVCEGNECGGLGCGACDDRTTGCVTAGSSFVCEDLCILLNECTGEPITTELGYSLTCEETAERTQCGARCISVQADVDNCGGCGVRCGSGGSCVDGVCECPGLDGRDCGGVCRDVSVDASNCGGCGVVCDDGDFCTEGVCGPPACPGGCAPGLECVAPGVCGVAGTVLIPAGTFTMGSPSGEVGRNTEETQHTVTLSRSFFMGQTEVTQGQWKALSGGVNPSYFQNTSCIVDTCSSTENANDSGPLEQVDWYSALGFANAKSTAEGLTACYTLTGCTDPATGWRDGAHSGCTGATFVGLTCNGYRLPTESEWEYAARAGTTTATYLGNLSVTVDDCTTADANLDGIAWWCKNSSYRSQAVGGKAANAWGLRDMLGNVWEWTWDRYGSSPSTVTDPLGATTGSNRLVRGGSWFNYARDARAANRYGDAPDRRSYGLGFRLARTAP